LLLSIIKKQKTNECVEDLNKKIFLLYVTFGTTN